MLLEIEATRNVLKFLDALEDNDDVQHVTVNIELDENMLETLM